MSNVIYPKEFFIDDTVENWENGSLGCDEKFAQKADPIDEDALNDAIKNGRIRWVEDD
jgi:hypothetical protein